MILFGFPEGVTRDGEVISNFTVFPGIPVRTNPVTLKYLLSKNSFVVDEMIKSDESAVFSEITKITDYWSMAFA